jgi:hypothetical protein
MTTTERAIGPFTPRHDPNGPVVTEEVERLVVPQVQALLRGTPAYYKVSDDLRDQMERDLSKIAAYSAALLQDGFSQAERLGQTPVVRREIVSPRSRTRNRTASPLVRAAADEDAFAGAGATDFAPRAVGQVATVTQETLGAINFPRFVSDLIRGTFNAIVDASIQQMEAYGELLANVAKTVDQFMADNITDNQARDYLAAKYPGHIAVQVADGVPQAQVREGADELPAPALQTDLGVPEGTRIDSDSVEQVLVPAARRQLAQSRHQLLSTMVLMGINRIVVTSGRVRAKLDFHIDSSDSGTAESASQFDVAHESSGSAGWFGFGNISHKTSVAYVQTARQVAKDDINVDVDLSGELDLKFKSETMPLERFADAAGIGQIQAGTANPGANPVAAPTPTPRD